MCLIDGRDAFRRIEYGERGGAKETQTRGCRYGNHPRFEGEGLPVEFFFFFFF